MFTEILAVLEKLFPRLALRAANRVDTILGQFDKITDDLDDAVRKIDAEIGQGRALIAKKRAAYEAVEAQQAAKAAVLDQKAAQAVRVKQRISALTR